MMDEATFETIFRQNFEVLINIANTVVKDRDVAKDIVQQVFYKLWQNREDVNIKSMKSYLHRAAINTALNHIDKHKRLVHVDNDQLIRNEEVEVDIGGLDLDEHDMNGMVASAINDLPPRCKLVFTLSRFEGLDNKEIAEYMETSTKTVENQMGKALKALREKLQPLLVRHLISLSGIIYLINLWDGWVYLIVGLS